MRNKVMMKSLIKKYSTDKKEKNDIDIENLTLNGININDININDINVNDIEEDIIDAKEEKKIPNENTIEYYLYDVKSYNNNNMNGENFVDLSTIKSTFLSENKKKKAKKKKGNYIKKQIKLYKKKYKILPEHNLDQDTNYEESIKNENKEYRKYDIEMKEENISNDFRQPKRKNSNVQTNIYLHVVKFILIISSIFLLGSFSTTITKYIIFVKKFNYAQFLTFLEFLIICLTLRIGGFIFKKKSSTDLTQKDYIRYIISVAALLSLSCVTGNCAYSYLEIPIISVLKSSSLILIYFLSIKFGLKEFKCSLLFSILTILMGVVMSITTLKIDSFYGLILLVLSVVASSFKWVFTNILLNSTSTKMHIILLHIYQVATTLIAIPWVIIDIGNIIKDYNAKIISFDQIYISLLLMSLGALTNIFLILAEFSIISYASSVTLSIVFIGREAIILIIGSIFFGEKISFSSSIGVAISMIGTVIYGYASK